MKPFDRINDRACNACRALLSEYTDNTLPAHDAWEVEKHLAACDGCASEARQLRATVDLLRMAPRRDTSDTFMASLHARLDTVDPALGRGRSAWERVRGWFAGSDGPSFANRVPALSFGIAVAALALLFASNRPNEPATPSAAAVTPPDSVHVSIAASANSPFSDPAAENLEFRAGSKSTSGPAAL
jgi:anti-sigma factor RsiW